MAVDLRQNHFRFGKNTGAENTHAFLGLEDAAISFPTGITFLLRIVVQETGASAAANTDFTWQYNRNGAGWNGITTTSNVIKAVANNCWSDGNNCTQRLTGSGTFESSGAGLTTDGSSGGNANDIAASGCSETEISLQIVHANVVNGDTIQIQVISPDFTVINNVTPSLTVIKNTNPGWAYTSSGAITPSAAITNKNITKTKASELSLAGSFTRLIETTRTTIQAGLPLVGSVIGIRTFLFGTLTWVYQAATTGAHEYTAQAITSFSGLVTRYLEKLRTYTSGLDLIASPTRLIEAIRAYKGDATPDGDISSTKELIRAYNGEISLAGESVPAKEMRRTEQGGLDLAGEPQTFKEIHRESTGDFLFDGDILQTAKELQRTKQGELALVGEIGTDFAVETYGADAGALTFAGEITAISKVLSRTKEGELSLDGEITETAKDLWRTEQGDLNLAGGMPPPIEIEIQVEIVSGHGASGEIRLDKRQDIDDILDIVNLVMGYGGYDEMY